MAANTSCWAKFKKTGGWSCPTCSVHNDDDKAKCAACETDKPGAAAPPAPKFNFGFGTPAEKKEEQTEKPKEEESKSAPAADCWAKFKKSGGWSCPTCSIHNSDDKTQCPACETKKPGAAPAAVPDFGFGFGRAGGSTTSTTGASSSASTWTFGSSSSSSSTAPATFTFGGMKPDAAEKKEEEKKEEKKPDLKACWGTFKMVGGWWCPSCSTHNPDDKQECACKTKKPDAGLSNVIPSFGSATETDAEKRKRSETSDDAPDAKKKKAEETN